jgi:hypothetical protein
MRAEVTPLRFVLNRFDRKHALLALSTGFGVSKPANAPESSKPTRAAAALPAAVID